MARVGHCYNHRQRSEVRVYAPDRKRVALVLLPQDRVIPMTAEAHGWWQVEVERLEPGARYRIEVDGIRYPDVASRCQPDGVHGASMVALPVRAASDGWRGVRIEDAIVYELHLGTFTAEGTLAAATDRLAHLAALGITVVELLPIAAFPGQRNWGYDGTYPFALHAGYGSYEELNTFIQGAHRLGIAVILDVVYNHFGPEGNYSAAFAPYTRNASTPWGAAINFDGEHSHGVREFFLENARYWLQEVGFDGFRMDAVASVFDETPVHLLRQITDLAREIGAAEGRELLMIAEHLRNDKKVTSPTGLHFDSQWNDDIHDAVFAFLTGERSGHLSNFGSFADVVKALDKGFVLDGTRFDRYRRSMTGTDGSDTRGTEHVVHLQNHDQIGNRPHGDRMITTYGIERALLGVTAMMATAFVPMLFMGEEFGATSPFLFFEDFGDPQVIENVRLGRLREFDLPISASGREPADPHSPDTFSACRLDWASCDNLEGRSVLTYYRRLIALKRAGELGPHDRSSVRIDGDEANGLIRIEAPLTLTLLNFSSRSQPASVPVDEWQEVLRSVTEKDNEDGMAPFAAVVYRRRRPG